MQIQHINIKGYRPFAEFDAEVQALEVIVGANGSGKSSLFEFLRFLRDGMYDVIPPEIVSGSIGQQVFHIPGPERIIWELAVGLDKNRLVPIIYSGELTGLIGSTNVSFEKVENAEPSIGHTTNYRYMDMNGRTGVIQDPDGGFKKQELTLPRANQLALSVVIDPRLSILSGLREYIREWRFYSAFNINNEKIRRSVPIEQQPTLHEDGGNLSSVLFYLMSEFPEVFRQLEVHLRGVIPGFKRLTVKARGGRGEVMTFWSEGGVDTDLTLADLSDGSLRLLCWFTLCLVPTPPTLICIDEPNQGVHPRTLPVLAGLLKKASLRTQLLVATHASYFLTQFDLDEIAVIRKENGASVFRRPANSKILIDMLTDFGTDELEALHRSDELEAFA
jgi:predicted ATPase